MSWERTIPHNNGNQQPSFTYNMRKGAVAHVRQLQTLATRATAVFEEARIKTLLVSSAQVETKETFTRRCIFLR
jgi:hypothetical protein